MRFLIPLGVRHDNIGGHMISAAAIGAKLIEYGHTVEYLFRKRSRALGAFPKTAKIHHFPTTNSKLDHITRALFCLRFLRKHHYDAIIAMDVSAAYHVAVGAAIHAIPVIPVIAGGGRLNCAPYEHPIIVVFTEEIKSILVTEFGWNGNSILVCGGRIDTNSFAPLRDERSKLPGDKVCIALLSRVDSDKRMGFVGLVEELEAIPAGLPLGNIDVEVYGMGEDMAWWRLYLENQKIPTGVDVRFCGQVTVTAEFLNEFDLVVGQGRGVLEALAAGVPVAVSGERGYMGRVSTTNFATFARTNFTGRSMSPQTQLAQDLVQILDHPAEKREEMMLRSIVEEQYSSESFCHVIIQQINTRGSNLIPAGGSAIKALWKFMCGQMKTVKHRARTQ